MDEAVAAGRQRAVRRTGRILSRRRARDDAAVRVEEVAVVALLVERLVAVSAVLQLTSRVAVVAADHVAVVALLAERRAALLDAVAAALRRQTVSSAAVVRDVATENTSVDDCYFLPPAR